MSSGGFPYGQRGKELVQELKRSEWLPKYNVRFYYIMDPCLILPRMMQFGK